MLTTLKLLIKSIGLRVPVILLLPISNHLIAIGYSMNYIRTYYVDNLHAWSQPYSQGQNLQDQALGLQVPRK